LAQVRGSWWWSGDRIQRLFTIAR